MFSFGSWAAITIFGLSGTVFGQQCSESQPIVDLGYLRHQALYNSTGRYYNFTNIRYAAPPLGDLRFAAPQAPAVNRTGVQTGLDVGGTCPQAEPSWISIAPQFIVQYLQGQTVFNASSFNYNSTTTMAAVQDPMESEDCLFLDVVVPEDIFNSNEQHPVLVWIYGGGYTAGSKSGSGNPAGLLARSESNNSSGVIYVAMNYRLGAFGWLSGPTFQANGTANAGLYDQRFALDWVQKNIHLFGGDPKQVTVLGESAGGGSIEHHITAYGGAKGPAPFAKAIPQSPGFFPTVSASVQENTFNEFLSLLNVSTLEEARRLPSSALQQANARQIGGSLYGQFVYGPVVDGNYVPALPGQLLLHGQYDKSIELMTGHNADEGLLFTSPFIQNNTAFAAFLVLAFPTLAAFPDRLSYITEVLYPPIFDGSHSYTSQVGRAIALISEVTFTCNTVWLHTALGVNSSYGYIFNIPPSIHGQDIPYTYYNGNGSTVPAAGLSVGVSSVSTAYDLQEYITQFAKTGNPNGNGLASFPVYGNNGTVLYLNPGGNIPGIDPAKNQRCQWWQLGLYS